MQQNTRRRRQKSRFGQQMEEKQTLKGIYGIREKQLKRYYKEALRARGETGPLMVEYLERRLDNALYRAGFAQTRPAARQMASHGLVTVNGRSVDVPSLRLKPGDKIQIKQNKREKKLFANFEKRLQNVALPDWLVFGKDGFDFNVTGLPDADEAHLGVDMRTIIEFFAR